MEILTHNKLTMYLAVKSVCDAKPAVWQSSEAFAAAYTDFCERIGNIIRLQPPNGIFNPVAQGIAVEMEVADTILTTELDELIERFEAIDVAFVDEYTAARSMDFPDDPSAPVTPQRHS